MTGMLREAGRVFSPDRSSRTDGRFLDCGEARPVLQNGYILTTQEQYNMAVISKAPDYKFVGVGSAIKSCRICPIFSNAYASKSMRECVVLYVSAL